MNLETTTSKIFLLNNFGTPKLEVTLFYNDLTNDFWKLINNYQKRGLNFLNVDYISII